MTLIPPVQCSISLLDDPREKLVFESFPGAIGESYTATWNVLPSGKARATAQTSARWQRGSFGAVSVKLDFVAGANYIRERALDAQSLDVDLDTELQKMERKVRWLEALCFPRGFLPRSATDRRNGILRGEPPEILLAYGSFYIIRGIATNFTVAWAAPFHPVTVRPYRASVTMGITRLDMFYPDYYDILDVADRRTPPKVDLVEFAQNYGRDLKTLATAMDDVGVQARDYVSEIFQRGWQGQVE